MSDLEDENDYIASESSEEDAIECTPNERISKAVINDIAVLIFLWIIGQTASFRDVANRFDITISSLHRINKRMLIFLKNLSPRVITWLSDNEKRIMEQHFRENGFSNIIGAIDGNHIKIDKPENDPDSYINRKGYYSIQMQVVCDHTRKIRDILICGLSRVCTRQASCVLHNISINDKFDLNDDIELLNEVLPAQDVDLEGEDEEDERNARRIRDDIVNNLTM
ncbi:hypothetical protein NQ314_017505 [Rhamnusium bicolor]|uniref:DDE Tnp4 domain-containing protein n=1 Tax=Rhamnusium bicolor TaxID=1586634 RepID=A0AAV8WT47_9CUCU|nr:hypothetical protein NQ314_017505 [Rhamnusium bicolor]